MSAAICPYCRTPIVVEENNEMLCPGCATPHHADCFAENGGCTVFGCSAAPPEEPKLRLTGSEIAASVSAPVASASGDAFPTMASSQGSPSVPSAGSANANTARLKAPPPPLPGAPPAASVPVPRFGAGSVLFGAQPVAAVATAPVATAFSFEPDPDAKNRMTFIILGVLLGAFGAHNFYAGYGKKAAAQLCITVLSMGLASPMSWVWAVIDVSTVDVDAKGIKFRS